MTVNGVHQQHMGPKSEYARIEVLAEPATSFEVRFGPDVGESDPSRIFLEAAVFGLLDILLVSRTYPLRNIRITLTHCEIHPVDSSQIAFRQAGRDAGMKIINALSSAGKQ
jgi:translation elongation factor EF-G